MRYTEIYLQSFELEHPLTDEQLRIIKDTIRYKRCELADALSDLKGSCFTYSGINKFIENIKHWLKI